MLYPERINKKGIIHIAVYFYGLGNINNIAVQRIG
jgi:hypothetical protein